MSWTDPSPAYLAVSLVDAGGGGGGGEPLRVPAGGRAGLCIRTDDAHGLAFRVTKASVGVSWRVWNRVI